MRSFFFTVEVLTLVGLVRGVSKLSASLTTPADSGWRRQRAPVAERHPRCGAGARPAGAPPGGQPVGNSGRFGSNPSEIVVEAPGVEDEMAIPQGDNMLGVSRRSRIRSCRSTSLRVALRTPNSGRCLSGLAAATSCKQSESHVGRFFQWPGIESEVGSFGCWT